MSDVIPIPRFEDIVRVLDQYRGRYRFFDAFVDDIIEFRDGSWERVSTSLTTDPHRIVYVTAGDRGIRSEMRPRGVVRFSLESPAPGAVAAGAGVGAVTRELVSTAMGEARDAKEGPLGGLVLGLLIGALHVAAVGSAVEVDMQRVMTLQFDRATSRWQIYDGALLRWAKEQLASATA